MERIYTLLIASAFTLLAGCGSQVAHLYQDPDFQHQAIADGGLVVVAVVAVPGVQEGSLGAERSYALRMTDALTTRRPDLELRDASDVPTVLGPGEYQALNNRYRSRGNFGIESLNKLQSLAPLARYAAFCRLESNSVIQSGSDSSTLSADTIDYSSNLTSERVIVASFDVFDVAERRLVWTAQFSKDNTRTRQREHGSRDLDNPDEIERAGKWADAGDFPDAPEFLEMLDAMFEDFARHLPEYTEQ
jgi:hypothetical protein